MITRDQVIAWLGADRAAIIEKRKPGAINSGINLVAGLPASLQVAGAAIRALHAAGEAGTPEDNWLYANPGKTRADYPPNVQAAEAAKVKEAEQNAAAAAAKAAAADAAAKAAEAEAAQAEAAAGHTS